MSAELPPSAEPDRTSSPVPLGEETRDYAADDATAELVRILDEYLADLKAGRAPSRDELLARHPALAEQLRACLSGLEFLHETETAGAGRGRKLGDFRILREVGRGGMGAVFEAEQVSLGRRVALKILRFGGVSDPEALERFQREAETVAKLHHTNIVPIFAVGNEGGVNYYAMQFIEGRSLAEVLAERARPLPPERVAEWGLQAAEALWHAHQRGVIHRDVKPSNLLLDNEQRLWLTDFGLARRVDDVTLSLTGALLGTPRYMSPEQAAAAKKRIDHRTDLFSLGATLYELLAAQPAFRGDTPHDVIQQIIQSEPRPLRELNSAVPRDLETIVMKCLVKEPAQRYASARDLADDLRAFLDGRPIRARRASPVEVAIRWFRQHRRSVTLSGTAAVTTLLLTLASIGGWSSYDTWRQASIRLDAVNPPLVAEFLRSGEEPLRVDTLPMQNAAHFPAGDYRVRVSADGQLSQTIQLALERGQSLEYKVGLSDQLLLHPLDVEQTFDVVDLGEEQALVFWNRDGVGLRKLRGSQQGWSVKLGAENVKISQSAPGFRWPWRPASAIHSGYGSFTYSPWLVRQAVDVDGDGVADLLTAGRHQAWLMALSGRDGSVLWIAPRGAQVREPLPADWQFQLGRPQGAVVGEPVLTPDHDGDGVPDLLATILEVSADAQIERNQYVAQRAVEMISARTGQTIWRFELPAHLFELPDGVDVPYDLRWFTGANSGTMSSGRATMLSGRHISRARPHQERTGVHAYLPSPATLVQIEGQTRVGLIAGTHVVFLELESGRLLREPIALGARPGKPPVWAELDGDGSDDLVFLEEFGLVAVPRDPQARLHVWSPARHRGLWQLALHALWPQRPGWTIDTPQWPLVVDLNGDGRCEIVVPHGSSRASGALGVGPGTDVTPWGGIAVFAGDTGKELWNRKLVSMDAQVDAFVDGPDLNGDGTREVYAVTLAGSDATIYVDALSGASGQTLWTNQQVVRNDEGSWGSPSLAPPRWWKSGDDGWPQLMVQAVDENSGTRHTLACGFSAGTGQRTRHGTGITALRPVDLDHDGLEELLIYRAKSVDQFDLGGALQCVRGIGGRPWKRLGVLGAPTVDLDGDGIRDLVRSWGDGTLIATSGATGRELWRSRPLPAVDELIVRAAGPLDRQAIAEPAPTTSLRPAGDLDGDGVVDLLVLERSSGGRGAIAPLHAISGRSGRLIWSIAEVRARILTGTLALGSQDLDGDGAEEIVWLAALDHGYPQRSSFSTSDSQLQLFVVDGRTGKVVWSQALSPQYGLAPGSSPAYQFHHVALPLAHGDLDGDGKSDLLVPAIDEGGAIELRALRGTDGQELWSRPRPPDGHSQESLRRWIAPVVGDLDGDSRPEVILAEPSTQLANQSGMAPEIRLVVLAGDHGNEIWSRPTGATYAVTAARLAGGDYHPRPVLLRDGAKRRRIGIRLAGGNDKLLVFEPDGQSHERALRHQSQVDELWVCDVDRDGAEEIIFVNESTLFVAAPDRLEEPLWQRKLGSIDQQQILDVLPPGSDRSPVIVFRTDPTDNSVLGIDAANGQTVWLCPGPNTVEPGSGVYLVANRVDLLGVPPDQAPLIHYEMGFLADCRQAVWYRSKETSTKFTRASVSNFGGLGVRVVPPHLGGGVASDPRWKRNLPWHSPYEIGGSRLAAFVAWSSFFSLTLVVIPAGYVARLIVKRRFSLQTLLVLPVVASVFLMAAMLQGPGDNDFQSLPTRFLTGLGFAPPLVAIGLFVRWSAMGNWRRIALWLGLVLVLSFIWGTGLICVERSLAPPMPEESLDWTGWYDILLLGGYVTSWLMLFGLGGQLLFRWVWKSWFRRPAANASA